MNPKRPHPPQDEGELLLSRFLDGELDAGEHTDFQDWLRQDPSHVERFVKHTIDHHRTAELLRVDRLASMVDIDHDPEVYDGEVMSGLVEEALAQRRKHELEAEAERKLAEQQARIAHDNRYLLRRSQPPPREMVLPKPVLWLGLAALVGLAVWFGWPSNEPPTPRTAQQGGTDVPAVNSPVSNVAVIRNSVDARWAPGVNGDTQHLQAGNEITLRSGLVEVVFGNGTTVILEGPVTFEPTGPDSMRLVSGRLNAMMSDADAAFSVTTGSGDVTNRGSEFGVLVDDEGRTLAQAFSGPLRLSPAGGGDAFDLRPGEAAIVSRTGSVRPVEPDELRFVRDEEYTARRDSDQSPYNRWLAYSYELRRDPSVVAYFVFDREDNRAGRLVNRADSQARHADGYLGDGANLVEPRWIEGRFQQTRALRFGDAGGDRAYGVVVPDYPALDLLDEMTFALWVRITQVQTVTGTLLSKRTVPASRLNYQLALMSGWRDGEREFQFGAGVDDASLAGFSYSFTSGQLRRNEWIHVAVTTDGRTVRYYIDGRRVGVGSQEIPAVTNNAPLLIGATPSGLEMPIADGMTPFGGDISEVLIASRTFTDRDIRTLYQQGRPTD
ncbi:MAG: LamG domain-containing protein [Phycisphaerales bacterium JB063]